MFKLEAIRARHGDTLLLHYGIADAPRYALIDGGPARVWAEHLQSVLDALRTDDHVLPLRWVALSHVDDDHVHGLLDLFKDEKKRGKNATAATRWLLHNTPGPPASQGGVASTGSGAPTNSVRANIEAELTRVAALRDPVAVASYRQGTDLANLASALHVGRNPPNGLRLLAGDEIPANVVGPLRVRVVSPTPEIMARLIHEWEQELGANGGVDVAAVETRVENLSSIVLLVELGDKRMLLTGDALDTDVIEGLSVLGELDEDGVCHVDLLKLPHHGAQGNNHAALFAAVKAKHYVISADGHYGNPDPPTLSLLVESERKRRITIWLTNGPNEGTDKDAVLLDARFALLEQLIADNGATGIKVRHPKPGEQSVIITLEA
jgi:metallo-beta-lactamase superfamily protein